MLYRSFLNYTPEQLFQEFFYGFPKETKPPISWEIQKEGKSDNFKLSIQVALAGFSPDDIKVWNEGNTLFIEGSNQASDKVLKKFHQTFSWKIPLTDKLEVSNTQVSFENGLLTIDVPSKNTEQYRNYHFPTKPEKALTE